MATITLTPNGGTALNLLDATAVMLERETTIESLLPPPTYDEEYADSSDTEGARRVRSRPQNPTGTGKVRITGSTSSVFWANVRTWEQTAEAVRVNGGTLAYTPTNGTAVTYDIESFALTALPQDNVFLSANFAESEFTVTYHPYGRGASTSLVSGIISTEPVVDLQITSALGNRPTGSVDALGLLTLTDNATKARDHFEWGLDPDYNPSATDTPSLVAAASLVVTGLAGSATSRSGAYGTGNNVIRATLGTAPVGVCDTQSYSHTRRWRVKARVYAAGTGPVWVRFAWKVGDGPRTRNTFVQVPATAAWYELDLGLVTIPVALQGGQSWQGRVEAYSAVTADTLDVNYLELMPAYRYGKARAPFANLSPQVFTALDSFDQTAGSLSGKTMTVGGNWSGAGDADDFALDTTNHVAQRTAVSDSTGEQNGRFEIVGTNLTDTSVMVFFSSSAVVGQRHGVFARYTDTNNWLVAYLATADNRIYLVKRVASVTTTITSVASKYVLSDAIQLTVDAAGRAYVFESPGAILGSPVIATYDADLITGGALASGKPGMFDHHYNATACTRSYDNFSAWAPSLNHSIQSGKAAQVSHQGAIRQPATGTAWGKVPAYEGAYLRIPPNRDCRIVVKARRLDVDTLPDADIADSLRMDISATPRVVLL